MNEMNPNRAPRNPGMAPMMERENPAPKKKKAKKQKTGTTGRVIRRSLLMFFTIILLLVGALIMVLNQLLNSPYEEVNAQMVMTLLEPSGTKWIPALFKGQETVDAIRNDEGVQLPDDLPVEAAVEVNFDTTSATSDEWKNYPDGIRIEEYKGMNFTAHIMIIRDPSQVYMATSTPGAFSTNIPGTRITEQIETEGAIAAINAGAFNDDGTAGSHVGSIPAGLLLSNGVVRSNTYHDLVPEEGFAGFDKDNKLHVADKMTKAEAEALGIRDGCEFGPVLIQDGKVNQKTYNSNSGRNPRTAIGQRADGAVIFLCIDGRQADSLGGTYSEVIDLMLEYGAVNACNMDGGSSSVMLYRDQYGLYGEPGQVQMINSYSLLQSEPRRMPNFWMVRPAQEG